MTNFEDFLLTELYEAYQKARKGKRKTMDAHKFEVNEMENLVRLRDAIINRQYEPSRGVAFIIHDPVTREVFAAPFVDRVVHHFLFKFAIAWWDKRLIRSSYSCRIGKGTLYGIKDLANQIRKVSQNYTKPAYVIKLDLQGYFMSLNHKKLYARICWGLNRQFPNGGELYRTLKYLWRKIIFDDPTKNVTIRGRRSDWHDLPSSKSLFHQPKGRGIVIGNLTSQLLSNIFLDLLDRFITLELGYKHYGRYVDDFFIVVPAEDYPKAHADIEKIRQFLAEELGLTLHPRKRYEQPVEHGVAFLGAVIYPGHIIPGKRIARNFKKAAYQLATTGEGKLDSIGSYVGHLAHIDSKKLIKKTFDNLGW